MSGGQADFAEYVSRLVGEKGYGRNPCRPYCHDCGDPGHAHLRTPDGRQDFILWASGVVSPYDLTQPTRLIYPMWLREALLVREAEERDRREWIEDVKRRLGLVTRDE